MMEARRLTSAHITALLPSLLMHAQYIDDEVRYNSRINTSNGVEQNRVFCCIESGCHQAVFDDEDVADVYFDADEWARVREQTLTDAFMVLFEGQRMALLQHTAMAFEQVHYRTNPYPLNFVGRAC